MDDDEDLSIEDLEELLEWSDSGQRRNGLVPTDGWIDRSLRRLLREHLELREVYAFRLEGIKDIEREFGALLHIASQARRVSKERETHPFPRLCESLDAWAKIKAAVALDESESDDRIDPP